MVLKAAIQALKKADVLKAQAAHANATLQNDKGNCTNVLLNDSTTWSTRQELTNALHQVLVLDLDYALDQKVEQELWTHGFKNYIATLQLLSRDKKNPKRAELQALLAWCLESATGFYLTLFQELCEAFQLDLPFRRRGVAYGSLVGRSIDQPVIPPQRSSCLYICQYCLVHLGDIARYRNQRKQAESFYKQAILLSPSSGQPYNQLALLQASRGDRLSTVFYYIRSVSLTHPFPPAATNLTKTLEMAINDSSNSESRTKMSVTEYTTQFLNLHGLLQTGSELNKAEIMVKNLTSTLTALAATESFSCHRLLQMLAINFYSLKEATENFTEDQLSCDEKRIKNLVLDLIAGFFNAFLLPVYTLQSSNLLEYHSLPAIKLILEWIKLDPKYLESNEFASRLQIWPSLCLLLNSIQPLIKDFEEKKYTQIPLPEDRDLQGFLPLDKAFNKLDFSIEDYKQETDLLNKLRASRLIHLGRWLTTYQLNGNYLITSRLSDDKCEYTFEAVMKQEESNVSDLLKELEQMKIDNDSSADVTSSTSKENSQDDESVSQFSVEQPTTKGILKPQGSLERAREEREQAMLLTSASSENSLISSNNSDTSSSITTSAVAKVTVSTTTSNTSTNNTVPNKPSKKVRQNVAMQAILKKVEENSKQVKFQTDDIDVTLDRPVKDSENIPKEDIASKKGILSLKNQSGYPHLVEVDNNIPPKHDIYQRKQQQQLSSTNVEQKPSFENLQSAPSLNNTSQQFPNTLPSNNTNFPLNSFPSPPYNNNQNRFPPPNSYRNIPDFISQQQNTQPQNMQPNPQYFLQKDSAFKYPPPNQGGGGQPFDFNTPINQMPNYLQQQPPPPQTFGNQNPNMMYHPPTNNTPPQYNTQFPNQNQQMFGKMFPQNNDFGMHSKKDYPTSIPQDMNKPQQPPSLFGQSINSYQKNNLWNNQIDNKLPMPPNGWWPNNPPDPLPNRYQTNSYDSYNLPLPQQAPPSNSHQSKFMPDSFINDLPKPGDGLMGLGGPPPQHRTPWNTSNLQHSSPPGANITAPTNSYQQIMMSNQPNMNKNLPHSNITNNDQGLTMRQKILKENKKLYSKKSIDSLSDTPFENPNIQAHSMSPPGYSLFSSNWAPNLSNTSSMSASPTVNNQNEQPLAILGQQSLFSGPGPSPLERLLEQQKQLRGVPPKLN